MISAVRRADLLDQLTEVVFDIGPMLDTMPWLEQVDDVCTAARLAFGAAAVSVAVLEEDHLRYVAAAGEGAGAIVGTELPLTRGLAGYVAMAGQALAVDEPAADPRFARDVAERTGYVPQTLLLVPITGPAGAPVGVLTVLDRTVAAANALELGTAFARLAAPALTTLGEAGATSRVLLDAFAEAVAGSAPTLGPSLRRALDRRPDTGEDVVALAATLNTVRRLDPAARRQVAEIVDAVVELAGRRRSR